MFLLLYSIQFVTFQKTLASNKIKQSGKLPACDNLNSYAVLK